MSRKQYNVTVPRMPGQSPYSDNMTFDAAAVSGGLAFLTSELEKLDPQLREPLTSTNYPRDIDIESGGGWVEATSAMNVDYAVTGGQGDGVGGVQNNIRRIQANLSKDLYKVMPYEVAMSVKIQDVLRGGVTGRSLESIYETGIRLDYDKYMDINTYLGQTAYGTTGLLNNKQITAVSVAVGASGQTAWKNKTPKEILDDVDEAIMAAWGASDYDNRAIPNHILIDPISYAYINRTIISVTGTDGAVSILKYLVDNNIAVNKDIDLFIGESKFCAGAGVGGTNRMVAYVNNKTYVGMDVPVPMSRIITMPNINSATYDSLYMANVGEVKVHYVEPFIYRDGI